MGMTHWNTDLQDGEKSQEKKLKYMQQGREGRKGTGLKQNSEEKPMIFYKSDRE